MTDYTLIRRGRKAYIACFDTFNHDVIAFCDDVADAKMIMEAVEKQGNHNHEFVVASVGTTRGLRAMLCVRSVVPKEGLRCIATGSADSLKQLVEDLSPNEGKKK
jgi:hypothetical protein